MNARPLSRWRHLLIAAFLVAPAGSFAAEVCDRQAAFTLAVHGGVYSKSNAQTKSRVDFIEMILAMHKSRAKAGAPALDLVESLIMTMENSGIFNAGKGSITNRDGYVEADASIMRGDTLDAGAVAGLQGIKNPIAAARHAMEASPHVMFVGGNGEKWLKDEGLESVPADYFVNYRQDAASLPLSEDPEAKSGTVGAVVLDRCGNLAAGTSTGGYDTKIAGRVGDSPIIGAGTYASNKSAAISATGYGEYFIRYTAARDIAARMEFGGEDLASAVDAEILGAMAQAGGVGGVVAIDKDGHFHPAHSTPGMFYGVVTHKSMASAAAKVE